MFKCTAFQFVLTALVTVVSVVATDFSLVMLPSSTPVGGKCLDGTQAGFYFRPGVNPSIVVISLQGGGYCSSKGLCDLRAGTELGSSSYWPDQPSTEALAKNVLMDRSCSKNPDFCKATTIYIPHCTADIHIGTRTEGSDKTCGYIFDGYHNFVAIIDMLIEDYGLGDATKVLLTGVSTGGVAVFHNLDTLADRLPSSTTVVKGAPIAGWYLTGPHPTDPSSMYVFSDYQNFAAGQSGNNVPSPFNTDLWGSYENIPQDCIADLGDVLPCTTIHNRYKYVKSNLFVVQAQYDPKHAYVYGAAPGEDKPFLNSTDQEYFEFIGQAARESFEQIINDEAYTMKPHPDGLYAASCEHHNVPRAPMYIDGFKWNEMLIDWFFEKNDFESYHKLVETCSYESGELELPCNPVENCALDIGDPILASCWFGLEEKGCVSPSQSEQSCRQCAQGNKPYLRNEGCTIPIVLDFCSEL